jgi:hypothetical protein
MTAAIVKIKERKKSAQKPPETSETSQTQIRTYPLLMCAPGRVKCARCQMALGYPLGTPLKLDP